MAIEVGDILRLAFSWLVDGSDQVVNVHTVQVSDLGATGTDIGVFTELVGAWESEVYSAILTRMADNVVGDLVTGLNLTKLEVLPPIANPIDGAGTTADAMARQVTALVCLNGAEPRRQGRTYLPVGKENDFGDNGVWDAATLTALANFGLGELLEIIDTGAGCYRVISNADGSSWFYPTAVVVPTAPRTQRRRTPGRGA